MLNANRQATGTLTFLAIELIPWAINWVCQSTRLTLTHSPHYSFYWQTISSRKYTGEPEHNYSKVSFSSPNSMLHPHGCRVTFLIILFMLPFWMCQLVQRGQEMCRKSAHGLLWGLVARPCLWEAGDEGLKSKNSLHWKAFKRHLVQPSSGWGRLETLHSQDCILDSRLCRKWMESSL